MLFVAILLCLGLMLELRHKERKLDRAAEAADAYWFLHEKIEALALSPHVSFRKTKLESLRPQARHYDEMRKKLNVLAGIKITFVSLESIVCRALDGRTPLKVIAA